MILKHAKQTMTRMMSPLIKAKLREYKDKMALNALQRTECKPGNLRHISDLSTGDIFNSDEIQSMWTDSKKEIDALTIPDENGGVNPGDRKALYFLICKLSPLSVLEIGTHIGASTLHIASALHTSQIRSGNAASLTSVDIVDVNSSLEKPWMKYGANKSPREMVEAANCGSFVEFVTDTSINYAVNCDRKFDFIFLDGDHSAQTVYQEIPVALNLLNRDGVIVLHDYFPDMKPLWSNGSAIPGPFLATEQLCKEGANLAVLPLGKLPWPTKLQSNVTSLALLLRNG